MQLTLEQKNQPRQVLFLIPRSYSLFPLEKDRKHVHPLRIFKPVLSASRSLNPLFTGKALHFLTILPKTGTLKISSFAM